MTGAEMWAAVLEELPKVAIAVGGALAAWGVPRLLERLRLPKEVRAALAKTRPLAARAVEYARSTPTPWDDVGAELWEQMLDLLAGEGIEVTPEIDVIVAKKVAQAARQAKKAKLTA